MANSRLDCDSFGFSVPPSEADRFLSLLRRHLPLRARPGARIVARAKAKTAGAPASRCSVVQVYDAGDARGLLCHLEFAEAGARGAILIAPITELSFERGSPVFREIAAYQKSRRARSGDEATGRLSTRR